MFLQSCAVRQIIDHRPQSSYGENIYYHEGDDISATDAVKAWYDEIANYDFDVPVFNTATGHFTQLIWKDSKELGIGVVIR